MRKPLVIAMLAASVVLFFFFLSVKGNAQSRSGESLFKEYCATCHANGGNILNPKKTLHKKDLDANSIRKAEDIVKKMRNPGPFPEHPQEWAGMKIFDEKTISNEDALKIADYILKTFK